MTRKFHKDHAQNILFTASFIIGLVLTLAILVWIPYGTGVMWSNLYDLDTGWLTNWFMGAGTLIACVIIILIVTLIIKTGAALIDYIFPEEFDSNGYSKGRKGR